MMAMSRPSILSDDVRCRDYDSIFHDPYFCLECRKIFEVEAKRSLNANKLRFRFVREYTRENIKMVVYDILNRAFRVPLIDIGYCTRVYPWEKPGRPYWPHDIVVTFRKQKTRDLVYEYKSSVELRNPGLRILEELIPERGLMWKKAVLFFGYERVNTLDGIINVFTYKNKNVRVYTMTQLSELIWEEKRFLQNQDRQAKSARPKYYQWRKY